MLCEKLVPTKSISDVRSEVLVESAIEASFEGTNLIAEIFWETKQGVLQQDPLDLDTIPLKSPL